MESKHCFDASQSSDASYSWTQVATFDMNTIALACSGSDHVRSDLFRFWPWTDAVIAHVEELVSDAHNDMTKSALTFAGHPSDLDWKSQQAALVGQPPQALVFIAKADDVRKLACLVPAVPRFDQEERYVWSSCVPLTPIVSKELLDACSNPLENLRQASCVFSLRLSESDFLVVVGYECGSLAFYKEGLCVAIAPNSVGRPVLRLECEPGTCMSSRSLVVLWKAHKTIGRLHVLQIAHSISNKDKRQYGYEAYRPAILKSSQWTFVQIDYSGELTSMRALSDSRRALGGRFSVEPDEESICQKSLSFEEGRPAVVPSRLQLLVSGSAPSFALFEVDAGESQRENMSRRSTPTALMKSMWHSIRQSPGGAGSSMEVRSLPVKSSFHDNKDRCFTFLDMSATTLSEDCMQPCFFVGVDSGGRIFVGDVEDCCILSILKGYRSSEVQWMRSGARPRPGALSHENDLLMVHHPSRGWLEIWQPVRGIMSARFELTGRRTDFVQLVPSDASNFLLDSSGALWEVTIGSVATESERTTFVRNEAKTSTVHPIASCQSLEAVLQSLSLEKGKVGELRMGSDWVHLGVVSCVRLALDIRYVHHRLAISPVISLLTKQRDLALLFELMRDYSSRFGRVSLKGITESGLGAGQSEVIRLLGSMRSSEVTKSVRTTLDVALARFDALSHWNLYCVWRTFLGCVELRAKQEARGMLAYLYFGNLFLCDDSLAHPDSVEKWTRHANAIMRLSGLTLHDLADLFLCFWLTFSLQELLELVFLRHGMQKLALMWSIFGESMLLALRDVTDRSTSYSDVSRLMFLANVWFSSGSHAEGHENELWTAQVESLFMLCRGFHIAAQYFSDFPVDREFTYCSRQRGMSSIRPFLDPDEHALCILLELRRYHDAALLVFRIGNRAAVFDGSQVVTILSVHIGARLKSLSADEQGLVQKTLGKAAWRWIMESGNDLLASEVDDGDFGLYLAECRLLVSWLNENVPDASEVAVRSLFLVDALDALGAVS
ncbi:hypothetical protein FVE85_8364 [Porphyridium purpureum]|uniref:Rab3-GAP regulatory subunit N-terminal domain-containing protein n=1 Tax=Porphyridium purpureum TaxID=35688 RepID=A0A5J4YLL5_PORPP|nr:hypothetical protein FVE85_8364 [Porphyridium purpureum]|eukprot:POR9359..scf244_11